MGLEDTIEEINPATQIKFKGYRPDPRGIKAYIDLMGGVLLQAFEDIETYQRYVKDRKVMTPIIESNYKSAIIFLKSRDREHVFSFENIASEIDGDPEIGRKRIEKRYGIKLGD